ncbi:MAG: citrate synthase [Fibrobacter sp.]|nr:citrate synthase [Fibrobacter sp.]
MEKATIKYDQNEYELPIVRSSIGEPALDISNMRSETGLITLDPGFHNTGSAQSEICYRDPQSNTLRYRGYDVQDLAHHTTFTETAYLLIYGELPDLEQKENFRRMLTEHSLIHQDMLHFFVGLPPGANPMGILSSMINAMALYYPNFYVDNSDPEAFDLMVARLISKVRTIAAFSYKKSLGEPFVYPVATRSYCDNFLHMMFHSPTESYEADPVLIKALNVALILHAEHEQNCSTSTVRLVGSSHANLYASVCAGVCALWGPLHGGTSYNAIKTLRKIQQGDLSITEAIEKTKNPRDPFRLVGFGHPIYSGEDPRVTILKKYLAEVYEHQGMDSSLYQIAQELEFQSSKEDYFAENNLYPNLSFYAGLLYEAIGIPDNMFTVMFAIGRLPSWIAHWKEMHSDPSFKLGRPRQVYTGIIQKDFIPIEHRNG